MLYHHKYYTSNVIILSLIFVIIMELGRAEKCFTECFCYTGKNFNVGITLSFKVLLFNHNSLFVIWWAYSLLFLSGCSCVDKCRKLRKDVEYCTAVCQDNSKYLNCQEKCQTSNGEISNCIFNDACFKQCNSKCSGDWPGMFCLLTKCWTRSILSKYLWIIINDLFHLQF